MRLRSVAALFVSFLAVFALVLTFAPERVTGQVGQPATGPTADGVAAAGNPVRIGGIDQFGNARNIDVEQTSHSINTWFQSTAADGTGNNLTGFGLGGNTVLLPVQGAYSFAEASGVGLDTPGWNRWRGNNDVTFLTSASRTTTQTSVDLFNYNSRGIHVILDMTVVGTGSVTLTINGKDQTSGKYYALLVGAAVITNVTNIYRVYPGLVAVNNATANDLLPRVFQLVVTANNANAATYSVGFSLIL